MAARKGDDQPRRACCLVSEILEESGFDRQKARQIRRQILEGMILLCQWQLERIPDTPPAPGGPRRARKVAVE